MLQNKIGPVSYDPLKLYHKGWQFDLTEINNKTYQLLHMGFFNRFIWSIQKTPQFTIETVMNLQPVTCLAAETNA